MLGNHFFIPGEFYQVITHRPDTAHFNHFFETGTIVRCVDVTHAHKHLTVGGYEDFSHDSLTGLFVDENGLDQTLCTGDVKRCRSI